MKLLTYTDEDGFTHQSLVRDNDTDPSIGLIQSPPDLRQLDWEAIARNIHNALLERGLLTIQDVQIRSVEFARVFGGSHVRTVKSFLGRNDSLVSRGQGQPALLHG